MNNFLPYLVPGIVAGSIYGLAGLGLTLTYRTTGILNFAHGAVATCITYLFFVTLRTDLGLPTLLAFILALGVVAPATGLLFHLLIFRWLAEATTATRVVATLGLLVALQGGVLKVYSGQTRTAAPLFPQSTFRLPGLNVGWDQAIVALIVVGCAVGLTIVLTRSHVGLESRAVTESAELSELTGVNADRTKAISWMVGTVFAGLSGILLAPVFGLDAVTITLVVVVAFSGSVIGKLSSFPGTYGGALAIGIVASFASRLVIDYPVLRGIPTSTPFIALFLVLLLRKKGSFVEATSTKERISSGADRLRRMQPLQLAAVIALLAAVPPLLLEGRDVAKVTHVVIFALIFVSLSLVVGLSRQVSLGHAVFVGIGGAITAHLLNAGVPFPLALALGGASVVPLGAVLAIPAVRLSGLFLALATFGFGVLAQDLLYLRGWVFGSKGVIAIGRPSLFGVQLSDNGYYLFALAVCSTAIVVVEVIWRSRLGRTLKALADSSTAAESLGVRASTARVITFSISAGIAGIGGGLLGPLFSGIGNLGGSYSYFQSLLWVAVLVAAGARTTGGPILAAVLLIGLPYIFTGPAVVEWQPIAFGVLAIVFAGSENGILSFRFRPNWKSLAVDGRKRLASARHSDRVRAVVEANHAGTEA